MGQENVFVDILETKKAFLDPKITKLKKSKIWYFSKGVSPWFFVKFSMFLFSPKSEGKMCLTLF